MHWRFFSDFSLARTIDRFCLAWASVSKSGGISVSGTGGCPGYQRSSVTGIFLLWCSSQWHPGQTITVLSWPLSSYSDSARSGLCRISFLWWTIAMIALTAECNEILTLFNIINFGIATFVVCRYVEIPNDDSNEI